MARILVLLLCASCATPGEDINTDVKSWVGRPFADYQALMKKSSSYANRSGWKETSSILPNGNREIVGYQLEGEGCN